MAKTLIPQKGIILIDNDGNITEVLLQYKLNTDGVIPRDVRTISVKSALDQSSLDALAQAAIASAKQSEGI